MGMSLDEAIKENEDKAEFFGRLEVASKHRQYAEWFKELKQRREADKVADAQLRELIEEVRK